MIRQSLLRRLLIGASLLSLVVTPSAFAEDTMTLEDVIACHVESRGGADAIKGMKSMRLIGTMSMAAAGIEAPFTLEFERPNKVRTEFTIQGMTGIMAYDGEVGWSVLPFMGKTEPEKMADDQLKQVKKQSDQLEGFLFNWEEKGHQVEYLGMEEVEGTPAHKLQVVTKDGDSMMLYLDTDYCLDFRQETTIEMMGQKMNAVVNIGDYKEVDGLLLPFSIESVPEGATSGENITFSEIKVNLDIDDARFAMPEVSAKAEAAEGGE